MLLNDFLENDLVDIKSTAAKNWRDAIKQSGEKLIAHQYIRPEYMTEVISNVEKNGPYIVIVPGVAMPHALAESENVLGTAISFTKFPEPVIFDKNNPDSSAQLFFTLAAKDPDQHLANISELSDLLMTDGLIDRLLTVQNLSDYKTLLDEENKKRG
ncbi:PTS sugar transporter subunit IIA [Lactiplantibacillus pentosus]|uniref:Ascorbate-specific PTS system EIIA component n=1 Tax=Lactiplantibacillus pentosus TaxID=1589 RepID=A0AB37RHS0_LACPE|nr:PTS sugar transporter subunit IIA [Lactiplantibacillus pentosus]RMW42387.1 PTS sugar transporter subunit IIA [Lactiplantibacillus pentosus]RMW48443.1 PTS sugar transporter subunit IIA [Lactiplantibacillus pentosus]RMW52580.1 PTS sugar transporter subunit IIA [Lactiplantibacillus pentosus]RMW55314.1 PTS sugar transporter subunit IIA [Lactiplantibacillus pentosus]